MSESRRNSGTMCVHGPTSRLDSIDGCRRRLPCRVPGHPARHPLRPGVPVVRGGRDGLLPRPRVRGAAARDDQDASPAQNDPRVGNRWRGLSRTGRSSVRLAAAPDAAPALQPRCLPAGRPARYATGRRRTRGGGGLTFLGGGACRPLHGSRGACGEMGRPAGSLARAGAHQRSIPSCTCASAATAWIGSSREWRSGGGRCKIRASMEHRR